MRRSGFTMVELIFVIIIIGILSVAAIPKFGDIKDRAKSATEFSALSSLSSAIEGAMEFQREDFNNIYVDWHNANWTTDLSTTYGNVNSDKSVLNKLLKKNENFEIVAYADVGATGGDGIYDDVFFIKGKASNETLGSKEADLDNALNGKPDKTDVWAFNASPDDVNITYFTGTNSNSKILASGDIVVIDLIKDAIYTDTTAAAADGELTVGVSTTLHTVIEL